MKAVAAGWLRSGRAVAALAAGLAGLAAGAAVPAEVAERARPIDAVVAARLADDAAVRGWGALAADLEEVVREQAGRPYGAAARSWAVAWRWAAWWARSSAGARREWVEALRAVGHPYRYEVTGTAEGPELGTLLPAGLHAAALGPDGWGPLFLRQVSPLDEPVATARLVARLAAERPESFRRLPALALAIAFVHDLPPPPWWPHGQVTEADLPRALPDPVALFAYWAEAPAGRRPLVDLSRLGPDELRFLVDVPVPLAELEREAAGRRPLAELGRAYDEVRYDRARVEEGRYVWPHGAYTVAAVRERGGICVDQAFVTLVAAQARGVPALLLAGAGVEARHAWVAHLGPGDRWVLDVGRGAEGRYVTGRGLDPQTWTELTDHQLAFETGRFRGRARADEVAYHTDLALLHRRRGELAEAVRRVRLALGLERREASLWEIAGELAAAAEGRVRGVAGPAAVWREAAGAFQDVAELEVHFALRLNAALRARGEGSAADAEMMRMLRKHEAARPDLSVRLAAGVMEAVRRHGMVEAKNTYERILVTLGDSGGILLFDMVVRPFVTELREAGDRDGTARAVQLARRHLRAPAGSQLAEEMEELARGPAAAADGR